jgi:uncharacterized protein (TIGR03000 family)
MYSVVFMMAMTSGGNVADLGHRHGGCCGGESYSACCGGGESYSACCGGGRHRHHRHHRGSSCCGGGYSACCGGYSGYSGCCGGYGGYSGYSGCCGGYGGYSACNGGYGGYIEGAGCAGGHPVIIDEGHEGHEMHRDGVKKEEEIKKPGKKGDNKEEEIKKPAPKPEAAAPAPATIIVTLPADATLTIDDAATTSTASPRVFTSPVLPTGKDFHYTLKAKYVRAGQPVVLSREVTVRAGQETRVNLETGLAGVASR